MDAGLMSENILVVILNWSPCYCYTLTILSEMETEVNNND